MVSVWWANKTFGFSSTLMSAEMLYYEDKNKDRAKSFTSNFLFRFQTVGNNQL